jgi:photosystem II stability/assembly factor-like uncharacterized protein
MNPMVAYAGADHPGAAGGSGGLYKTLDGGRNWVRMGGVLDKFDVAAVVTHPSEPNTVFVATAEGGPFKSVDGGVTWIGLDRFGTMADSVNAIARPPLADNVLAATQGFGIQTCAADGQQTHSRSRPTQPMPLPTRASSTWPRVRRVGPPRH